MGRPFEPVVPVPLERQRGETFTRLVELMQRLLAPDGCSWDRAQSFGSLRRFVLEEAFEVAEAIDGGDRNELRGELGDLLFQVVFQAELGRAEGSFGPDDVIKGIIDKLVRRHPHVFGEADGADPDVIARQWERQKAAERAEKGEHRLLDGFAKALPALTLAYKVSSRVAKVGFDWPSIRGSRDKVTEELGELDEALESTDRDRIEDELGDVLFAVVNLARHAGVEPEAALRRTIAKFQGRFAGVEDRVRARHGDWPEEPLDLEELDGYWEDEKRALRARESSSSPPQGTDA